MAKFEGRKDCDCCGKGVDVYSDKGGKAYYNCGPCGVRVLHRGAKMNAQVLAGLDRDTEADDGTPAAPAPLAKPAPAAPPREAVATPPVPPKTKAPEKKPGFFANLHLG